MKRETICNILIGIVVILILVAIVIIISESKERKEQTIERCKAKGWDSAEYIGGLGIDMICINIPQAEKDAMPGVGE